MGDVDPYMQKNSTMSKSSGPLSLSDDMNAISKLFPSWQLASDTPYLIDCAGRSGTWINMMHTTRNSLRKATVEAELLFNLAMTFLEYEKEHHDYFICSFRGSLPIIVFYEMLWKLERKQTRWCITFSLLV